MNIPRIGQVWVDLDIRQATDIRAMNSEPEQATGADAVQRRFVVIEAVGPEWIDVRNAVTGKITTVRRRAFHPGGPGTGRLPSQGFILAEDGRR